MRRNGKKMNHGVMCHSEGSQNSGVRVMIFMRGGVGGIIQSWCGGDDDEEEEEEEDDEDNDDEEDDEGDDEDDLLIWVYLPGTILATEAHRMGLPAPP